MGVRHGVIVADADVVFHDCHCCDCSCLGHSCPLFSMPQLLLPLPLPLLVRVLVVVAATVVFRLHLEGRHGDKVVDRERVEIVVDPSHDCDSDYQAIDGSTKEATTHQQRNGQ